MKITKWTKNLCAAIVAAGIWAPGVAYAVNIPLGDAGFENFSVAGLGGYAYADAYRPAGSPWVDDLDSPPGYTQDNVASAWLYDANYAETANVNNNAPSPRVGGSQAMHGLFNYTAQETSAVFESGQTYTFSLWAQNDQLLDNTNGLFMYIFDGTVAFSEANSLANILHTAAIPARTAGMSQAQSQANWALVSVSHTVLPGASEIGHPVGVGFLRGEIRQWMMRR